jgi:hypothetical protein
VASRQSASTLAAAAAGCGAAAADGGGLEVGGGAALLVLITEARCTASDSAMGLGEKFTSLLSGMKAAARREDGRGRAGGR